MLGLVKRALGSGKFTLGAQSSCPPAQVGFPQTTLGFSPRHRKSAFDLLVFYVGAEGLSGGRLEGRSQSPSRLVPVEKVGNCTFLFASVRSSVVRGKPTGVRPMIKAVVC